MGLLPDRLKVGQRILIPLILVRFQVWQQEVLWYYLCMYYRSKKVSLIILFITAVVLSLASTLFFKDQENQTIINGLLQAVLVYILSLAAYLYDPSTKPTDLGNQIDSIGLSVIQHASLVQFTGFKRLLFAVGIQLILVIGMFLYFN